VVVVVVVAASSRRLHTVSAPTAGAC